MKEQTLLAALTRIAERWPADANPPVEGDYDDTESAFSNGMDVSTYEAAVIARAAIESAAALTLNPRMHPMTVLRPRSVPECVESLAT
jgi:hypothetical protein